jgi:hypothetical protein
VEVPLPSHVTHIETLFIKRRGLEEWDQHFQVRREGGQKLKQDQLFSQGISKAQINHNIITYDQVTSCLKGFLVGFHSLKVMSFQSTFFSSSGVS